MADQSQQPQPQPQPPDPMVVVINAAVQAAMNYQQANQHQFPTASGKNYKIVDQTPFDGKLKQLNPSFRNVKWGSRSSPTVMIPLTNRSSMHFPLWKVGSQRPGRTNTSRHEKANSI